MRTLIVSVALFFFLFLGFCACRFSNKIIAFDPRFSEHISAYTSGMIGVRSSIRIELRTPLPTKGALPDTSLLNDLFEFEPQIEGKAHWLSERTIVFVPNQVMSHKTFYNAVFHLSKLKKVKHELQDFHFQFSTYEQHEYVMLEGLQLYNNYEVNYQRLVGSIRTLDYSDTALIKKTVVVEQDGVAMRIKWSFAYNEGIIQSNFTIDSVKRKPEASHVKVSWDGSTIEAKELGYKELIVPALGDYQVNDVRIRNDEDEQAVDIEFSEPLLPTQNLDGIITIEGADKLKFSVSGNLVTVFFEEPPLGIKRIRVSNAIKNIRGYKMKTPFESSLEFNPPYPRLRIVGKGCILPNSQGLIFPFETINLKAVEVRVIKIFENNIHQFLQINELDGNEGLRRVGVVLKEKRISLQYNKNVLTKWTKHVIDLNQLIQPDPGSIYRISIKFSKEDMIYTCDTSGQTPVEDKINEVKLNLGEAERNWDKLNWNENYFDEYESWGDYSENNTPCDDGYCTGKAVSRNILASDLGIIFKLDENKLSHTFISNMITTLPMDQVQVAFYDYTNQLITKGVTNASGKCEVVLNQKPFLLVAQYGKQRGYLKLVEANANSLSKFDIDGEQVFYGIKGFLYAERGVWRPGDSIYLNFVLSDPQHILPTKHPVYFELHDPSGKIIAQRSITTAVNHTYDLRTATGANAPTGNYLATVRVGNFEYNKSLHVETVKPNRLKITFENKSLLCESNSKESISLKAKWLHGADAKNLKAKVYARVYPAASGFEAYKNYLFNSPLRTCISGEALIYDSTLNNTGAATILVNRHLKSNAPGLLNISLSTKVFEESGDFSIDKTTYRYSPFENYIGLQTPNENSDWLKYNTAYKFNVVTINQNAKPVDITKLHLQVFKIEWRWWYEADEEDASAYLTKAGTYCVMDSFISTKNGNTCFNFKSIEKSYARYLIVITDEKGGHQTGKIINFDYPYWGQANQSNAENATMLNFSCDKQNYKKGEKVKLTIPSAAKGSALISIERGNRVVQTNWIATEKGVTKYEFTATAAMSPNAYIHVTLIQPHINTINDLPIRMYGVVPFTVDDENSHLTPLITMPDVIRPESNVTIAVREAKGKAMTYTLAIVDDGLLDLTHFKTPEIWNAFNAKEALGVKTWDMYDNVIGAYAGKLDHLLSIGGDGSNDGSNATKANRFKPMVKFMGPFYVSAGQSKSHTVSIPNYIGRVRVMVVAQNESAFGSTEKEVEVNKPLMLLATMPRVISPDETISIPVDVFVMNDQLKDVKVELETSNLLTIQAAKQQTIHFEKKGDELLYFTVKVAQRVGIAKIKVKATAGKETAYQEIEIEVRMPNPLIAKTQDVVINQGEEKSVNLQFTNITGTNTATVEVSNIPPINLNNRLDYLIQYPHGCIEQTTSSVFPQLYIGRLQELTAAQQKQLSYNIKKAIQRLQLFQTFSGGFSYWPNENYASEYGSNYAGHFIIEAEKQGYVVPAFMKQQWVKYQQNLAKNWNINAYYLRYESNELIQAYRLYTLALAGNPDLASMNRFRELDTKNVTAKCLLAMAYKSISQNEIAQQLVANINWKIAPYQELTYSYGSDIRDKAIVLMALQIVKDKSTYQDLVNELCKDLSSNNWYSTQETAYSLLAVCQYYELAAASKITYTYQLGNRTVQANSSIKMISKLNWTDADFSGGTTLKLKNTGTTKLFVKVIVKGVPLMGDTSVSASNLKIQVDYTDRTGKPIVVQKLKQGTDFMATVTITNPGTKGELKEMCLNQLFPSGWEIHNERLNTDNSTTPVRYQDIRDDRVYSYYDLVEKGSITVQVKLNATYCGRFYLPAVYSEAMYNQSIHANTKPQWIEVVR